MDTKTFVTDDIYRIYEVNHSILNEIAFVRSKESMKEYLESCNKWNNDRDIIYFTEKIKIEKLIKIKKMGIYSKEQVLFSTLNNNLNNRIITKSKRVTFNAIANNTVDLGIIKTLFSFQDPAYLASLITVVPQGVDTTIFNNHVELLMFVNSTGLHLYVKTYKAANNVSLDLYGVIFTS